jgi:hypothetical protein
VKKIKELIHAHPARVSAWVSSTVVLVITALSPDINADAAVIFVLSSLGLGEYTQRVENKKTVAASKE